MLEYQGKMYARVSDILQPFTTFGHIDKEILDRKAALGTRVHDAIDQEIKGEFPALLLQEQGYFKSFEKWRDCLSPRFIETETRYYCSKKMITGRIDTVVELHGEEKAVLVDFKTSVQESPTWIMQAHLYHYLLLESGKMIAPRFIFLKLDRYGNLPTVYQYKFDNNVMNRCLQAVDSFWEKQKLA